MKDITLEQAIENKLDVHEVLQASWELINSQDEVIQAYSQLVKSMEELYRAKDKFEVVFFDAVGDAIDEESSKTRSHNAGLDDVSDAELKEFIKDWNKKVDRIGRIMQEMEEKGNG